MNKTKKSNRQTNCGLNTLLRPIDIAWQAFQAGAVLYDRDEREDLHDQFIAWWKKHPQTLKNGRLKTTE